MESAGVLSLSSLVGFLIRQQLVLKLVPYTCTFHEVFYMYKLEKISREKIEKNSPNPMYALDSLFVSRRDPRGGLP